MGQLVPGIGAAAGAALNVAFTEYFSDVAKYHFGLRRLERFHGEAAVRRLYEEARRNLPERRFMGLRRIK
jgi:hypothetical protein